MTRKAKKVRVAKAQPMRGDNKAPNGLTPADNVRHHHTVMQRAQKKLDDAKALLRKAEKSAVRDGIVLKDYREAISNEKKSEKDLFTRHNNVTHYMKSLGISFHRNFTLLGKAKEPDSSPDAVRTRAYDRGHDDGLAGRPQDKTYDAGSPAGQSYLKGWQDGQAELGKSAFRGDDKKGESKPEAKNENKEETPPLSGAPKPWTPFGPN
jgi:ribosome modulation factor